MRVEFPAHMCERGMERGPRRGHIVARLRPSRLTEEDAPGDRGSGRTRGRGTDFGIWSRE